MKAALLFTEIGMGVYWILAAFSAFGIVEIPAEYLYSDYQNPKVVAWNWSFFPLDLIFIVSGIAAFCTDGSSARKAELFQLGLTAMFCSGLMAISYWVILCEFDPIWWGANIWLMCLPVLAYVSLRKADP